jgi:cell division protein FtsB
VAGLVVTVLFVGVLVVAVFPTSTWLGQRRDTQAAEAELARIQAERARIATETKRLSTDAEIEKEARAGGYVMPGEEAYNVLPAAIGAVGLPDVWPFTGVERALGAR